MMRYMDEIFANVYADIQRGKYGMTSARKIMRNQTDAVQRAEQNKKATGQKTAPPEQKFAVDKYYDRQIDKWDGKDHGGAFRVGTVSEEMDEANEVFAIAKGEQKRLLRMGNERSLQN